MHFRTFSRITRLISHQRDIVQDSILRHLTVPAQEQHTPHTARWVYLLSSQTEKDEHEGIG